MYTGAQLYYLQVILQIWMKESTDHNETDLPYFLTFLYYKKRKKSQSPFFIQLQVAQVANPFPETEMEGKQNMEAHLHFHHLSCCPVAYIMVSA